MPRNRSERDSDKARNIVTDTDGMFMTEVTKNFRSVRQKVRSAGKYPTLYAKQDLENL